MCDKANITTSTCWCTNQIKCLVLRTWHISNEVIYKLKTFQMVSLCYLSFKGCSHKLIATVNLEGLKYDWWLLSGVNLIVSTVMWVTKKRTLLCSHTLKGMLIFCDGVCTSRHCLVYYIWFLYLRVWFSWFRYKNHHSKYNTPDNINRVIFNLLWIVWQSHTSSWFFVLGIIWI